MRVKIHDELPPEANAMLQALYSRSPSSVDVHLDKVRERGSDNFMSSYYVGYGHASIGDCGYTTIYIEGISLLACKAIQDNLLYAGQETSTRYIDFSKRALIDPINTRASISIAHRWMAFYQAAEPTLRRHLVDSITKPDTQSEGVWQKAISARCFDILRGFLPAGVTSQVAWTTNLRQAHDHSLRLISHPLSEVRAIGTACLDALKLHYPKSFSHNILPEALEYLGMIAETETYTTSQNAEKDFRYVCNINNALLEAECLQFLEKRPRKQNLPKSLSRFGQYHCQFLLDFGSFRDLQRHRGGLCRMPLLTDQFGMHPWYLHQLPNDLRQEAEQLLLEQGSHIQELRLLGISDRELQYLQPIGMLVPCNLYYDLPEMVYVAELRSGETSHPTLRMVAQAMAVALRREHPKLAIYINDSPDSFSLRRGTQDIFEVEVTRLKLAS